MDPKTTRAEVPPQRPCRLIRSGKWCVEHNESADPAEGRCWATPPQGACTECSQRCVGGFVFRRHLGHLECIAPLAVAALASETISVREAEQAVELVDLYCRARMNEARARAERERRSAGLVRALRDIGGLRALPGGEG